LIASADAFDGISAAAKALQFKTARFVNTRKPFDPVPMLEEMAAQWETGMNALNTCAVV
jgi:hypothetical protein